MTGIAIATSLRLAPAAWWPAGSSWAADFVGDRYMRNGAAVPASAAFSFTRASAKFAARADGLLVAFSANVPARTDLGLLLEPAATNLCTFSIDYLNAAWVRNGCTATPGQPDPAGGNTASLIQEANSGTMLRRTSNLTVTAGQAYTVSRIVRRGNCDWCRLLVGDGTAFANATWAWFNLATGNPGAVGTNGSGYGYIAHGMTALGAGYYHVTISMTAPSTTLNFGIASADADGDTNRANVGFGRGIDTQFILWNTQIEVGSPTSPILSFGSAAVRSGDALSVSASGHFLMSATFHDGPPQDFFIAGPAALPAFNSRQWKRLIATSA